jgi:AcrR family transcriptional regulator
MPEMSTPDLILAAAMELFSEKGYAAVTTKEIAAKARVNEVTLFRYFRTKLLLYNNVFAKYIFEPSFEDVFHKRISWDLAQDLLNFAVFFQDIIIKNSKLLRMSIKDSGEFMDQEYENNFLRRFPQLTKQELTSYFSVMKEKGVIAEEPEVLAVNFLMINSGLIISLFFDGFEMDQPFEKYREKVVEIFIKGIRN